MLFTFTEGFQTEDSRKKIVDSLLSKLSIEEKDDVKILETLQGVPAEGLAGLSAALMGVSSRNISLARRSVVHLLTQKFC